MLFAKVGYHHCVRRRLHACGPDFLPVGFVVRRSGTNALWIYFVHIPGKTFHHKLSTFTLCLGRPAGSVYGVISYNKIGRSPRHEREAFNCIHTTTNLDTLCVEHVRQPIAQTERMLVRLETIAFFKLVVEVCRSRL